MLEKTHTGASGKVFNVAPAQNILQYRFVKRAESGNDKQDFVAVSEALDGILGVSVSYRTDISLAGGGNYCVDVHLAGYGVFVETDDNTVVANDKVIPKAGGLATKSTDTSGFSVVAVYPDTQVIQPNGEAKIVRLLAIDLPKQY